MNLDDLHQKLVAAARANPPSERMPLAFEKRIMARLTTRPALDACAVWSRALWRAAAPCVAVMLLFGAWSLFAPSAGSSGNDLSQDLENTLLAAADQSQSSDSAW